MARNKEDSADIGKKDKGGKGIKDMLAGYPAKFWVNSALGKPMLMFGIILVVLGRGCDAIGMRSVAKADATFQQEMVTFNFEYEAKSADLDLKITKKDREIADLRESLKPDADQAKRDAVQKQISDMQKDKEPWYKELGKINADKDLKRAENNAGPWRKYREASARAATGHRMWSFYYTLMFIFGTLLLVVGILVVAFTGEGAERWIAYIMMAIITFSIYVGGAAWVESLATSATSVVSTLQPAQIPVPPPPRPPFGK